MLIQAQFAPSGDLQLDAYTYDPKEFSALESVLLKADIKPTFKKLPKDDASRIGQRYTAPSNQVSALESVLEGKFQPNGDFSPEPGTGDDSPPAPGTGNTYACREITLGGSGRGCRNLTAPSLDVAQVKCSLIARKENWFGGVARQGRC